MEDPVVKNPRAEVQEPSLAWHLKLKLLPNITASKIDAALAHLAKDLKLNELPK